MRGREEGGGRMWREAGGGSREEGGWRREEGGYSLAITVYIG